MSRISKDDYYLEIAKAVSLRSTCLRRQYGAVIVKNDEIISTGYNGSPRGEENCCDKGICWKEENNLPHNSSYAECKSVHAEMNAIISASRKDIIGGTLYLYGQNADGSKIEDIQPCNICSKLIKNADIERIVVGSSIQSEEEIYRKKIISQISILLPGDDVLSNRIVWFKYEASLFLEDVKNTAYSIHQKYNIDSIKRCVDIASLIESMKYSSKLNIILYIGFISSCGKIVPKLGAEARDYYLTTHKIDISTYLLGLNMGNVLYTEKEIVERCL